MSVLDKGLEEAVVTVKMLSKICGVSEVTLRKLARANIIPKQSRGAYPLVAGVKAVITHYRSEKPEHEESQLQEALKTRKLQAQTREAELNLAVREGILVTEEDHVSAMTEVLTVVRNELMNMPGHLAPQVVGLDSVKESMVVLKPAVEQTMVGLCETLAKLGESA